MDSEATVNKVSTQMLAEVSTQLGRVEMYRDCLRLAVKYNALLPQVFKDELISMDPQRAKT